jgi:hypothetical protein
MLDRCWADDHLNACNVSNDPFVTASLNKFQECFNKADSNSIKSWAVSQESFDELLSELNSRNLECLTKFDQSYSVRTVVDEFNNSCRYASGYTLESIVPIKASRLEGCGGVVYKKIDAKIYMTREKTRIELPLVLLFLMDQAAGHKLMMQIANFKILLNEQ